MIRALNPKILTSEDSSYKTVTLVSGKKSQKFFENIEV